MRSEKSFERLRGLAPEERIYELKNEKLIAEPSRELSALCGFLGVRYDDAMLSYPEKSIYSAPDPSLLFQWKRMQTPREVGRIEGRIGPMLEAAGYEPSGYSPVAPNGLERFLLDFEHSRGV